jgi:hypothetical protein
MRNLAIVLLLAIRLTAQSASTPSLPPDDAVRIAEFYRLASQIQDRLWPGWSAVPTPFLLVTESTEFLTHHPAPPADWKKLGPDLYARPRQFQTNLQATFPAFGPPAVIVIGEPANTHSQTSTPWLCTVMHEHFHQLQWSQPGYQDAVSALAISRGDNTGMWMLNYPFPYDKPEVGRQFAHLRDLLVTALAETDKKKFKRLTQEYIAERHKFFALVSPDDGKYFSFQLWQEGIARYTEVKSAEAAAQYQPTPEFAALPDYAPFSANAEHAREKTLGELKQADLAKMGRIAVYSFGAAEGFLLDRINPKWQDQYFRHMLSLDSYFPRSARR